MSKNSGNTKNMNCSKIIGIQFSILSPEEIRKGSVAEITSKEAYINNKPVINGLLLILCITFLIDSTYNPFIYFRF